MKQKKVVIGMSGGVDSSVAASLLQRAGYEVIALFMKNWEEETGACTAKDDYEDVARVCDRLQIPFYTVNFVKEYWESVFNKCLEEYQKGLTPNPDILCNREIKFKCFFEKAKSLGVDCVATGHYARIEKRGTGLSLLKGKDPGKDQSYFLYTLNKALFNDILFPIGAYHKEEVRAIAKDLGLSTAEKKDSTGLCFIGEQPFKPFLQKFIPKTPGNFETGTGEVVGRHEGIAFYTIGQRKGLGIGGPGSAWYVVGKDVARNVVIVEQGASHQSLFHRALSVKELHWIEEDLQFPLVCRAKIRYRQKDQACQVFLKENHLAYVSFELAQRVITPSQAIVFYDGEVCLGGGKIQSPLECVDESNFHSMSS